MVSNERVWTGSLVDTTRVAFQAGNTPGTEYQKHGLAQSKPSVDYPQPQQRIRSEWNQLIEKHSDEVHSWKGHVCCDVV